MRTKRVTFRHRWLPYLLVAPQLSITLVFFIWPAAQSIRQSMLREDAFGLKTTFVGLENFTALFHDPLYLRAPSVTTVIFSAAVAAAVDADRAAAGGDGGPRACASALAYRTLLIWPYAVAPAMAGVLWWFLFNPTIGLVANGLAAARL